MLEDCKASSYTKGSTINDLGGGGAEEKSKIFFFFFARMSFQIFFMRQLGRKNIFRKKSFDPAPSPCPPDD